MSAAHPPHENDLGFAAPAAGSVDAFRYCESVRKLTSEFSAPRIVAAGTPSKFASPKLLRPLATSGEGAMDQLIERCAGLDVHKATVTACVRVPASGGRRAQHVPTFRTTAAELLALRDWRSR
jgi:hypothetical protein